MVPSTPRHILFQLLIVCFVPESLPKGPGNSTASWCWAGLGAQVWRMGGIAERPHLVHYCK